MCNIKVEAIIKKESENGDMQHIYSCLHYSDMAGVRGGSADAASSAICSHASLLFSSTFSLIAGVVQLIQSSVVSAEDTGGPLKPCTFLFRSLRSVCKARQSFSNLWILACKASCSLSRTVFWKKHLKVHHYVADSAETLEQWCPDPALQDCKTGHNFRIFLRL